MNNSVRFKPEILAPAGNVEAALAAFAAGADAIYLGLKHFSARMLSENFSFTDLGRLADLAGAENRKIYIALNTVLKTDDLAPAGRLIARLERDIGPQALIVQDLAALDLARQTGFSGELHLSTLANITHPAALQAAAELGANRVILPRELSIDEIRQTCAAAPPDLALELFVHGALCYCVSGRCYWSSYLGGKSGLRGRCVQPCRRIYSLKNHKAALFSCLDLSLDLMAKTLLDIPNLRSWKIEGRRKGPHYVYYVTTAYRMLRDNPSDPATKKAVEDILAQALGRAPTRGLFLPQHKAAVTSPDGQTASGLFVGKLIREQPESKPGAGKAKKQTARDAKKTPPKPKLVLKPRLPLLPGDYLRVGMEDESAHFTTTISKAVPKNGALTLNHKGKMPDSGTPVYLLDRREPELAALLATWEKKLSSRPVREGRAITWLPALPTAISHKRGVQSILLRSSIPHGKETRGRKGGPQVTGLWLSPRTAEEVSRTVVPRISWWLPPVIWPDEESKWLRLLENILRNRAVSIVCNSPWQIQLLRNIRGNDLHGLEVVAGPFCNTTNPLSAQILQDMGFALAVVSPELSGEELLALPGKSPLPLGIVLSGFWPSGISRHGQNQKAYTETLLSPKREPYWMRRYGQNTWIYPAWPLDITLHREALFQAGYNCFVHIEEHLPKEITVPERSSPFNWELGLL